MVITVTYGSFVQWERRTLRHVRGFRAYSSCEIESVTTGEGKLASNCTPAADLHDRFKLFNL